MNTETTLYQLDEQLRLKGMASRMRAILELPVQSRPTLEMALAEMIEEELLYRKNSRIEKLLKASKLRFKTPLEEITCSEQRNLSREELLSLSSCDYIKQGRHILITGKAGCGKTWLSCALGRQACLMGYKVVFYNMIRFAEEITTATLTGGYLRFIERLMRYDLIILDDFGLRSIDEQARLAIYQLLDGNREDYKISLVLTSQLPVENWYDYLCAGSQTESILDRLLNFAHKVSLKGASMRNIKK